MNCTPTIFAMQTPSNITSNLQAHGEAGGAECWPWLDGVPAQLAAPLGNHGETYSTERGSPRRLGSLVLDGNAIKIRLQAERLETLTPVHVDWLRFTCRLRYSPAPDIDLLFPPVSEPDQGLTLVQFVTGMSLTANHQGRASYLQRLIAATPDCDKAPAIQARHLADQCAAILGPDFEVGDTINKGQDFYKFRWSIYRFGVEVGWVGYLASGNSPRQKAQSNTIHANLYGTACTFARSGWLSDMAALIDDHKADITRADLALDFFDGYGGAPVNSVVRTLKLR